MRHPGRHHVDRLQLEGILRETFASTAISYAINFTALTLARVPEASLLLYCCPCYVERTSGTKATRAETHAPTK
jgi:hypothetical protein